MRPTHIIQALAVFLLLGSTGSAQTPPAGGQRAGGAAPAPFKNLQVLPKDIPRPELTQIMQAINAALGVQCAYCHNFVAPGNPANDMASDEKTPKLVARVMMQMTSDINSRLAANIKKPADQLTRVGCATCHRGAAIPVVPPAPPPATPAAAPAAPGAR
jgi:photosynthetic reaction center cytochrome c subunit